MISGTSSHGREYGMRSRIGSAKSKFGRSEDTYWHKVREPMTRSWSPYGGAKNKDEPRPQCRATRLPISSPPTKPQDFMKDIPWGDSLRRCCA